MWEIKPSNGATEWLWYGGKTITSICCNPEELLKIKSLVNTSNLYLERINKPDYQDKIKQTIDCLCDLHPETPIVKERLTRLLK